MNPFSIAFGTEPGQYIQRFLPRDRIINTFTSDNPSTHIFLISGVRGSGKTVLLTDLSETLEKEKDWIVVNVTPDVDILNGIITRLYRHPGLDKLFIKAKIDVSFLGIGVSAEKERISPDPGAILESMLKELAAKGKKVLISIDEIVNNNYVKVFSSTFQLLLRLKLPIYLIMTGLYENIRNLKNEKTLTFLYRAPMEVLEPLNMNAIARSYAAVFRLSSDQAVEMARLTKGYAFAYQVLGYLCWEEKEKTGDRLLWENILPKYDEYLENYSYEKIWSELSGMEKKIVLALSKKEEYKTAEIRELLGLQSSEFSVYRERLKKKGLIDTSKYGYLSLSLPRFAEIIQIWA